MGQPPVAPAAEEPPQPVASSPAAAPTQATASEARPKRRPLAALDAGESVAEPVAPRADAGWTFVPESAAQELPSARLSAPPTYAGAVGGPVPWRGASAQGGPQSADESSEIPPES